MAKVGYWQIVFGVIILFAGMFAFVGILDLIARFIVYLMFKYKSDWPVVAFIAFLLTVAVLAVAALVYKLEWAIK